MNTKWKTALYWLAACIPLFIMLASLANLPDKIPMQYDFRGQVTRMGSKNELLLLPGMTILLAAGLRMIERAVIKSPRGEQNRKALDFTCWTVTIFMGSLSLVMLYYAGSQTQNIMQTNAMRIISLMVSVLFVVMGNLLPKCKRTGSYWLNIGFRTPWTLRSDMVWSKVNRLGGYAMVGVGLVGIAVSLLMPQLWGLKIIVVLMVIVALWGMVYSWWLYKEETRGS